ncbi:MAG: hypothetical protein DCC71_15740 [Proteobacteria bacterium]|nr:MAG: hypothetical protein DCC71_15740 [Pseudomonadota bacterium]
MARASDGEISRRAFLGGAALVLLAPGRALAQPEDTVESARPGLVAELKRVFETSPYAYISPLRKDGSESTCHGEVWFAFLDGSVVVNSRRGTWKVKALEKGLDRARLWIGDHGRWKPILGGSRNEAFRQAPSFDATARFETDRTVLDRLLASYETKYAGDFDRWREDMRTGVFSGQRKLIRYTPI